jgi:hypothetical protein
MRTGASAKRTDELEAAALPRIVRLLGALPLTLVAVAQRLWPQRFRGGGLRAAVARERPLSDVGPVDPDRRPVPVGRMATAE